MKDDKRKILEVTYSSGKKDIFEYGEKYTTFEGYFQTQPLECIVEEGDKVTKGQILTYNKGFFTYNKRDKTVEMSCGAMANVAFLENDVVNEDATEISERLSQQLSMFPVNARTVILNRRSQILDSVKVGDHVSHIDHLLTFVEEPMEGANSQLFQVDDDTLSLIAQLNRQTPRSRFGGKIVKIEAYYGCPISEMHPSLAKIVKASIEDTSVKNKLASDTTCADEFPPPGIMPEGSKYKGVTFSYDTVALIYYIQEEISANAGDKVTICNQLKCTTTGVFVKPVKSVSGVEIDALFSLDRLAARCVLSPLLHGISARVMEKLEADIVDMYFNDK